MGNAESGKANKQETNTGMNQLGDRAFGATFTLTPGPYGGDIESFMEQIDWYHRQMSLRDEKKPPTQALAGIAAALYSGLGPKVEVKSVVDLAWELWKTSDAKLNVELGRDEMPEVERRFKLLGVDWRVGRWPSNKDGTQVESLPITPFLKLFFPHQNHNDRVKHFRKYLEDNPKGKKRTPQEVEIVYGNLSSRDILFEDYEEYRPDLIIWWMKQDEFKPLSFPEDSLGKKQWETLVAAYPKEVDAR
ncbi:exodeoxyribonuclease V subunit gamma [Akkermansiaceae bacterium]|nr:exodeoxyribonuclease V subunit gamma [Akkermansiaceae bacterium]MDB4521156.1 exodeoxyribonuclease V subunit gamma [Akkermansiaceae bacterium]